MTNQNENTQLQVQQETQIIEKTPEERHFDFMWRKASLMASSDLVPNTFKGKPANCMIAMEMANRMGMNELMTMQNIVLIHGKPSWPSQFIISMINSSGRFSPLKFKMFGEGDQWSCIAYATEKESGEQLKSPTVSIEMAKKEGWYSKNGSKWQTMPELMLRYRAAAFFGRLYAPEYLNGMQTKEEMIDIGETDNDNSYQNAPNQIQRPEPENTIQNPEAEPVVRKNQTTENDEFQKMLNLASEQQIDQLKEKSGIQDFSNVSEDVKKKLIPVLNEILDSDF